MPRQRSPSSILAVPYTDTNLKAPVPSPTASIADSAYATTSKSPRIGLWFKPPEFPTDNTEPEEQTEIAPFNKKFDTPLSALRGPIRDLIDELIPPETAEEGEDEESERIIKTVEIQGGSSNRIIRLQFFTSGDAISNSPSLRKSRDHKKLLILRLPRYSALQPEQTSHYSTHSLLSNILPQATVPLSKIIHFDPSRDNLLDSPYTIQTFMPGRQLIYELKEGNIDLPGLYSIASQVASVYSACYNLRTNSPGKIDLYNTSTTPITPEPLKILDNLSETKHTYHMLSLYSYWPWYARDLRIPSTPTSSTLQDLIDRLLNFSRTLPHTQASLYCSPATYAQNTYARLMHILDVISEHSGIFSEDYNVLVHGDLLPHNILVSRSAEAVGGWKITTILDWDTAHFAAPVALFKPPTFLWKDLNDGRYKDDRIWADEDALPPSVPRRPSRSPPRSLDLSRSEPSVDLAPEAQRLLVRRHFEQTISSHHGIKEYRILAYSPWAKLARRVVELCNDGIVSEEGWCSVYEVFEMFLRVCREEGVDDGGVVGLGRREMGHWAEMKRRGSED